MSKHEETKQAVSQWMHEHVRQLAEVKSAADLAALTEELNGHLQKAGAVPVTLPCQCCVLLGIELHPIPSPFGLFFDIRPIRQPADKDLH